LTFAAPSEANGWRASLPEFLKGAEAACFAATAFVQNINPLRAQV